MYDRKEFWIINEDAFDEKLSELDEYRFVFEKSGDINMYRNNESGRPTRTVASADSSQKFYPFFFLNGRITALALMGIISPNRIAQTHAPTSQEADEETNTCKMCFDAPANCVLLPCGHIFFCSTCKIGYETQFGKMCPVDRKNLRIRP